MSRLVGERRVHLGQDLSARHHAVVFGKGCAQVLKTSHTLPEKKNGISFMGLFSLSTPT